MIDDLKGKAIKTSGIMRDANLAQRAQRDDINAISNTNNVMALQIEQANTETRIIQFQ